MTEPFVIVGGGLAAAAAARTLRENGYDGRLVIHCAEPHLPYERPPLSKDYLAGDKEVSSLATLSADWYAEHDVDVHLGSRVDRIDTARRRVHDGEHVQPYDTLLLATGCSPRRLPLADQSGAPVTYLRTVEDSDRLRGVLEPGRRVAIIGAGFLGLEVAATARTAGADVTVIENQPVPLMGVLGREVGHQFAELHRDHRVDLRLGVDVVGIETVDSQALVRLADRSGVAADLLLVGIGATPNTALAEQAGLAVDNGILVDEHLRTSDPHVLAAGDVANAWHPVLRRRLRVEHWDNARAQGEVAARTMLGEDAVHGAMPYFFTDQYDLGMEYVGHVGREGADEVVLRGDVAGRVFNAFWVTGGVVTAAMHVNDWDSIDALRRIVGRGDVDLGALRDADVPLDDLAPATGVR